MPDTDPTPLHHTRTGAVLHQDRRVEALTQRYGCLDCSLESNAAGLDRHQLVTHHEGRVKLDG